MKGTKIGTLQFCKVPIFIEYSILGFYSYFISNLLLLPLKEKQHLKKENKNILLSLVVYLVG